MWHNKVFLLISTFLLHINTQYWSTL